MSRSARRKKKRNVARNVASGSYSGRGGNVARNGGRLRPETHEEGLVRIQAEIDAFGSAALIERLNDRAISQGDVAGIVVPPFGERLRFAKPKPRWAPLFDVEVLQAGEGDDLLSFQNRIIGREYILSLVRWKDHPELGTRGMLERPEVARATLTVTSLGARRAVPATSELRAMRRLAESLNANQTEQYVVSGSFLETSSRSKLTYLFRKGLPTLVLRSSDEDQSVRPLVTLCLHTLGYFHGTVAGAMAPSDDVLMQLLMLRSDEVLLWRKCEQHSLVDPYSMV